jgi:hypothetical protein
MVLGIVVGAAIGYQKGKREDALCTPECGGPQIGTLVDPLAYGIVGGAIGAIVGYAFPT